jgi:HEAT repeat protein
MKGKSRATRTIRWILSLALLVTGLSVSWAWGQVARLAEPPPASAEPQTPALYAAWQPAETEQPLLFRSVDEGASWQPLALPEGAIPVAWAGDGGDRVAVALADGTLLRSEDRGDTWAGVAAGLSVLSMAWDGAGNLYLGTEGQGVHRLSAAGVLAPMAPAQAELASSSVQHLALAGNRLFAATPSVVFYTGVGSAGNVDNGASDPPQQWTKTLPVPDRISALAATDSETVFAGTETLGILRSEDAGRTWSPASEGLRLAAGLMVRVTALRADPREPGLVYAALSYGVGSTQVHYSAAGAFVTLDGGAAWQPLAGPTFPEAAHASDLLVADGRPLYAQVLTAGGLQSYAPDVAGALASLESDDPETRVSAARLLGLAGAQEAGDALLAALADPDPVVGLAAAQALGHIAAPETAGGLLVALEHPGEQVRLNAARALGLMGVEAAVEPLRAMLLTGKGAEIGVAGEALGRIGSPAATDALLAALAVPAPTARWHVAMSALETMGEPATGPLAAALESENVYLRRSAAQALGWIGSPATTPALLEALKDGDEAVRGQAAWALGEIGEPAAHDALARVQARDPSAAVQAAAGTALVRIGEGSVGDLRPSGGLAGARWPASWAPALNQLQAVRWLVLALSLVGALWLAAGNTRWSPVAVLPRANRH